MLRLVHYSAHATGTFHALLACVFYMPAPVWLHVSRDRCKSLQIAALRTWRLVVLRVSVFGLALSTSTVVSFAWLFAWCVFLLEVYSILVFLLYTL